MEPNNNTPQAQGGNTQVQQFQGSRQQASDLLEKYRIQIQQALPKILTPDRMIRVALTAMSRQPQLLQCTQASIIASVLTCAQLGLLPDGIIGEAYFIPFKNTKANRMDCTVIIGYKGLCTLAMRSGMVKSVQARAVYQGDSFEYEFGLEEKLKHIPHGETDPSKITHFYAVVKLNSGGHVFNVMTRSEIEAVRNESANYKFAQYKDSTIWGKHFAEMGNKTVLRRLMKYVPLSPELTRAVGLDEAGDAGIQKPQVDFYDDLPQETVDGVAEEILEDEAEKLEEKTQAKREQAADKAKAGEQATLDMMKKGK